MNLLRNKKTATTADSLDFKRNRGFTLVEILVAVAIFSLVMVMAVTMLLSVVDANVKAQTLKATLDNLNVALENMSRSIRVGTTYNINPAVSGCNQSNGSQCISFLSQDGHTVTYAYVASQNTITRTIDTDNIPVPIIASEVIIDDIRFFKPVSTQPYIIISIKGHAGTRAKNISSFAIQTTVSQRQ